MASIKGSADVVVIGGGVIGLAIARALARRGVRDVWLIERGSLGSEASSAAGGMLLPQVEADGHDDFFALACQIIERSPWLKEHVQVLRNELVFEEETRDPRTGGTFTRVHRLRALARDTRGLHGEPWSLVIRDELWSEPNH